jgi:hypothetical protein
MTAPHPRPDETARAPEGFRDALAELVQIGLSVARLVGRVAEAETALAEAASQISVADGVSPLAESLAQAIEADRAAAAAAEARQTVVARAEIVSVAASPWPGGRLPAGSRMPSGAKQTVSARSS